MNVACVCVCRIRELNSYQTNILLMLYGAQHCVYSHGASIELHRRYRLVLYHTRRFYPFLLLFAWHALLLRKFHFTVESCSHTAICHCNGMNKSVKTLFVFHPVSILCSLSTTQTQTYICLMAAASYSHKNILKLNAIYIFDHNGIICYISLCECMLG